MDRRGGRGRIEPEEPCAGYLRQPHNAPVVLYFQYPDGTKEGLCQVCANRFLLSDDEFPPKKEEKDSKKKQDASTLKYQAQTP